MSRGRRRWLVVVVPAPASPAHQHHHHKEYPMTAVKVHLAQPIADPSGGESLVSNVTFDAARWHIDENGFLHIFHTHRRGGDEQPSMGGFAPGTWTAVHVTDDTKGGTR